MTSEAELIAQSKQGDQEAIAELFRSHYASSVRLAYSILRHPDDAQDAVQLVQAAVVDGLLQLREARRRATWVGLEGRNGTQGTELMPSQTPTPEKSAWCREISSAFFAAVARLPKHLRDTYTLFEISGLSLREVATALGLTIAATKTRLFRARAGLRISLQPVWSLRRAR